MQQGFVGSELCLVHAGRQDAKALVLKGDQSRTRSILGISDELAGEELRGMVWDSSKLRPAAPLTGSALSVGR